MSKSLQSYIHALSVANDPEHLFSPHVTLHQSGFSEEEEERAFVGERDNTEGEQERERCGAHGVFSHADTLRKDLQKK
ncbi:hypothetical protein JOB18_021390 [Solea senegalensis]|uniref:Uncharacterized protein n=1 Tax=Solea senegalensis TaxID=28829 RepID=A0AAV6R386_SOLSE|nr:hypothetical protein JOB18_021390 [Solea senegalensis]